MHRPFCQTLALLCLSGFVAHSQADEGMWLFSAPPKEAVQKKYAFTMTDGWLEHLQKSAVRFNSGGSGSFVSSNGLVLTNHHVGSDALQKLSSEGRNLLADGFKAERSEEELKCVDLELNVLQTIEDVTGRVSAAVSPTAAPSEAAEARRKIIAEIEKESLEKTGLKSQVIKLYQGGEYHLYRFKRYTDVRLVFAPEQQAAFFGGDPDNFEYPRYNLDICFFRVYENGAPAKIDHFLKWSAAGPEVNELTFVAGHPGHTDRLLTLSELETLRDRTYPLRLEWLKRREVLLTNWSARNAENARRARDELFSIQNSRKARDGGQAGLNDPAFMAKKASEEKTFREKLANKPETQKAAEAFAKIEANSGEKDIAASVRSFLLEGGRGFDCESFRIARTLLRAAEELPKPNGERLDEFGDAEKESLELDLFSEKPIYPDLEVVLLGDALMFLSEKLGARDSLVQSILAGQSPRQRAASLILTTKVRDVAIRRSLYQGGKKAVDEAKDPMIEIARLIDPAARAIRKEAEAQQESKKQAHAEISAARYKINGSSGYPDATFSLRLAYGTVCGVEQDGVTHPASTTIQGLYDRGAAMNNREPFDVPRRWLEKKENVKLTTPFNFIGTHDIIGGNSGSPVVNKAGEFVGIIFDGNLPSLVLDFGYEDRFARSISVHSAGIIEALSSIYDANKLVQELGK